MHKKILLLFFAFSLCLAFASAGTITRSLSASTVEPGKDVTVNLAVNVSTETFYAIDETLPAGWAIKNSGTGATEQAGHIKWVVIEQAANAIYSYVITAPSVEGTANFTGKYMFEGHTVENEIAGAKSVLVAKPTSPASVIDPIMLIGIAVIAIVAIALVFVSKGGKKRKKKN